MIEQAIRSALVSAPAVSAIVGTRIYPLVMPQNAAKPAITYGRASTVPENGFAGWTGADSVRMQVDCWAQDYATAKTLAKAVRVAMDASALGSICIGDRDLPFEDDTKLFRVNLEFSIITEE